MKGPNPPKLSNFFEPQENYRNRVGQKGRGCTPSLPSSAIMFSGMAESDRRLVCSWHRRWRGGKAFLMCRSDWNPVRVSDRTVTAVLPSSRTHRSDETACLEPGHFHPICIESLVNHSSPTRQRNNDTHEAWHIFPLPCRSVINGPGETCSRDSVGSDILSNFMPSLAVWD